MNQSAGSVKAVGDFVLSSWSGQTDGLIPDDFLKIGIEFAGSVK